MILNLHGFLGPILGAVGGSLLSGIFGNAQNKSNQQSQQNAQNSAQQFDAAQLQKMIDFIKSQQQSAFSNLDSYLQAHPMPTANLPPIALPNQIDMPTIGGQSIGRNGAAQGLATDSPMTTPNANSTLLNAIWPGLLAQLQKFNAPPPPPPPTTPPPGKSVPGGPRQIPIEFPNGFGGKGIPQRFLL